MNINEKILDKMTDLCRTYFVQDDLCDSAIHFIHTRKQLPFSDLMYFHYGIFGGKNTDFLINIAAGVELLILAFDIFDDLEDQDHAEVPWNECPSPISMNIATGLLLVGNKVLGIAELPIEVVTIFNDLALRSVNGQHEDLLGKARDEKKYLEMINLKSGSLVALACGIGTALADRQHVEKTIEYGTYIGVASQLQNDLEDILQVGYKNDLLNKHYTLPALYLKSNIPMVRDYFNGHLSYTDFYKELPSTVVAVENSGVIDYMNVLIAIHLNKAKSIIQSMDISNHLKQKILDKIIKI